MMDRESSSTEASFQIAALQALLASLLSHANVRPPCLSQGLELFNRDFPVTKSSGFNEVSDHQPYGTFGGRQKSNLLFFSRDVHRAAEDYGLDGDDLYDSWLDNREEITDGVTNGEKHMEDVDKPGTTVKVPSPKRDASSADLDIASSHQDCGEDGVVKLGKNEESACQGICSSDVCHTQAIIAGISVEPAADRADVHRDVNPPVGSSIASNKGKMISCDSDSPSLDSLPDIVDADPDSD